MNRESQKSKECLISTNSGKTGYWGDQEAVLDIAQCNPESLESKEKVMEAVCETKNFMRALKRVVGNKGSAGVDGMETEDLSAFKLQALEELQTKLLEGTYRPQPIRRVEIPKPNGGKRQLGIPTVTDRLIM